jgi:hypothetical protein
MEWPNALAIASSTCASLRPMRSSPPRSFTTYFASSPPSLPRNSFTASRRALVPADVASDENHASASTRLMRLGGRWANSSRRGRPSRPGHVRSWSSCASTRSPPAAPRARWSRPPEWSAYRGGGRRRRRRSALRSEGPRRRAEAGSARAARLLEPLPRRGDRLGDGRPAWSVSGPGETAPSSAASACSSGALTVRARAGRRARNRPLWSSSSCCGWAARCVASMPMLRRCWLKDGGPCTVYTLDAPLSTAVRTSSSKSAWSESGSTRLQSL